MIPDLYERVEYIWTTTPPTLTRLATLIDALSCMETSSINSEWELVLEYPVNGHHADEIQIMRLIRTTQLFFIYRISKNAGAHTMTVYARHVNYLLSFIPSFPFNIRNCSPATFCQWASVYASNVFTVTTELTETHDVNMFDRNVGPTTARDYLLNDTYGAIGIYGGEWVFDDFTCTLKAAKGSQKDFRIVYGVDLIDAKQEEDLSNLVTHIIPYAYISDALTTSVALTDITYSQGQTKYVDRTDYAVIKTTNVHYQNFSHTPHIYVQTGGASEIDSEVVSLDAYYVASRGKAYALPGAADLPFKHCACVNILDDSVDVGQIIGLNWSRATYNTGTSNLVVGSVYPSGPDVRTNVTYTNTEQRASLTGMTLHYDVMRNLAAKYINSHPVTFPVDITVRSLPEFMAGVKLGDTITVEYPDYGISTQAEIMTMEYDVLREQIVSYTLGKGRTSFAETMLHQDNKIQRLDGLVTARNPLKGT